MSCFFGAHTARVKMACDWDGFPSEHIESLRVLKLKLKASWCSLQPIGRSKVIFRKLFGSNVTNPILSSPYTAYLGPPWILSLYRLFQTKERLLNIHDFLAIAEEMANAGRLGPSKMQMRRSNGRTHGCTICCMFFSSYRRVTIFLHNGVYRRGCHSLQPNPHSLMK